MQLEGAVGDLDHAHVAHVLDGGDDLAAVLDRVALDGDLAQIDGAVIDRPVIGAVASISLDGIRVNNAVNTLITGGYANIPSGKVLIRPTASANFIQRDRNVVVGGGTEMPATPLGGVYFGTVARWDAVPATNQPGTIAVEKIRSGQTFTSIEEFSSARVVTLTDQITTLVSFNGAGVTLPVNSAAAGIAGRLMRIVKGDAIGTTTISMGGTDALNGAGSYALTIQYQCVQIQASNVPNRWWIVGKC